MAGEPIRPQKGESPIDYLVRIDGSELKQAAADLARAAADLRKVQRAVYGDIGKKVAGWAKFAAAGGTPAQRKFAPFIVPRSTPSVARVAIGPSGGARATFWGMKRRSGWYANPRYRDSRGLQAPWWVGASWAAGQRGEGPYVINDVIADHRKEIDEMVLAAPMEVFRRATGGGRF